MRFSKIAIALIAIFGGALFLLVGYMAGHIHGREEGYQVGRNSLIRYIDTAEKHIEDRVNDVLAERKATNEWREKIVRQCGERRDMITRGVKRK